MQFGTTVRHPRVKLKMPIIIKNAIESIRSTLRIGITSRWTNPALDVSGVDRTILTRQCHCTNPTESRLLGHFVHGELYHRKLSSGYIRRRTS